MRGEKKKQDELYFVIDVESVNSSGVSASSTEK